VKVPEDTHASCQLREGPCPPRANVFTHTIDLVGTRSDYPIGLRFVNEWCISTCTEATTQADGV